jgi:hypothetical protein
MIRNVLFGVDGTMGNFGIIFNEEYTQKLMFIADYMEKAPDFVVFEAIDTMWNQLRRAELNA